MRIALASDFHLDRRQFNRQQRWQDYMQTFIKVTQRVGELAPDAYVIAGDLFEKYRPHPGVIRRFLQEVARLHCPIIAPDVSVVLDPTLVGTEDVAEGLKDDGAIIINTPEAPAAMREKLGITHGKVYTLDATKIAIEEIGRPIPNTPMIGALIKISGAMKLETIFHDIEKKFLKKLGERGVQGNINAVKRAHEEVQGE